MNINIRPYKAQDRAALRTLCCDVADRGKPIESIFPDREVAADLLTKYYTDFEPRSTFVAESEGKLVGYITGCVDNRRYGLAVAWIMMPALIIKAAGRGTFFHPQVRRILKAMLKNWRRLFVWRKKSFHSHQGHLHLGIAEGFRGQKVGSRLVGALAQYAMDKGITELTASVHDGNSSAVRFFSSQGFRVGERYPMTTLVNGQQEHYNSLLYVKTISH